MTTTLSDMTSLSRAYGCPLDDATVRACAEALWLRYRGAAVETFVPVLVERELRAVLDGTYSARALARSARPGAVSPG